jgi:hypothetical protein
MIKTPTWNEVAKDHWTPSAAGIWHHAFDFIPPNSTLKIETKGEWTISTLNVKLPPDGLPPDSGVTIIAPFANIAPGAVVAKIGGGAAELTPQIIIALGSYGIFKVDVGGPLFLGVNFRSMSCTCGGKLESVVSETT